MSDAVIHAAAPRLEVFPLTAVRVRGFLREFLERQRTGLSGHFTAQKYPFDTCLWEGVIDAKFRELDYRGLPRPVPGPNRWWPYEQTGYLLDGLLRLGLLLEDESMIALFRRNLEYLLDHAAPSGRLGGAAYHYDSEWPMAVFFKGVSAYLDVFDDARTLEAFHRHYASVPAEEFGDGSRGITNIEGLLDLARRTGDDALKEKAFAAYECFNARPPDEYADLRLTLAQLEHQANLVHHGVTFCEEIKLPVMLYLAGGGVRYLDAACRGWAGRMNRHGQIPGLPGSVEHGFGRDPESGYETCVISDSLYSLGFFVMAGAGARYADALEKIAFNALPGAVTKDFGALQYFSAPNQVLATPFSNATSFLYGQAPLRQYRPDHFAACCPGNVHRAMPNFISRMWMRDADGVPAAVCFGPAELSGQYRGCEYRIAEETEYPFADRIDFRFTVSGGGTIPFLWRRPDWCETMTVRLNGQTLSIPESSSGFLGLDGLRRGDVLSLELPMEPVCHHERQWVWFERGPLVYSLPVGHTTEKEEPAARFSPLVMEPRSPWNFAVAPNAGARVVSASDRPGYPLDTPPEFLEVPARTVPGAFAELERRRYTPRLPLFTEPGTPAILKLVPMGATETRLTAFPDGVKRQLLPVLSAYTIPDTEIARPEALDPMAFRDRAKEIRVDRDGYFDLARFYHRSRNCGAYLQVRFYAKTAGPATLAVMLSDGGEGFLDGKKVLDIPPIMEAEFMHPLWFPVTVHAGHNHLLLHVIDAVPSYDHRDAWGARVEAFR
ncbi:MAG: glycoside hydrolase family 127 protein [Lentisphaeria bacterium]|nr:glycoside hydrolase family 127 protein [Lentisphaeria bacterium]